MGNKVGKLWDQLRTMKFMCLARDVAAMEATDVSTPQDSGSNHASVLQLLLVIARIHL